MGRFWHFVQRISSLQLAATVSPMNWGRACPLVGIVPADTPSPLVSMLPQKWRKGLVCHAHKCAWLQGTLLYHAPIGQMYGCKGGNILRHKCRKIPSKMGKSIITTSGCGHRCSLLQYHPQKWGRTAPFFAASSPFCHKWQKNRHTSILAMPFWHKPCAILA